MKNIIITLISFLFSCIYLSSQQLVWTFSVDHTYGSNDAYVTVSVYKSTANPPTENLNSFNYGFYFKSAETNVYGLGPGQTGILNNTQLNAAVQVLVPWLPQQTLGVAALSPPQTKGGDTYDRWLSGQMFDDNFLGSNIGTTPVDILRVRFDHTAGTPFFGDNAWMLGSDDIPAMAYADNNFNEYPIVVQALNRTQPLPIKLSAFDAFRYGQRSARLVWTSETEVNSSHFEIERSTDGINWDYVGRVDAAGNSSEVIDYAYIDDNLPISRNAQNIFYYRLRMVDIDGQFEYSQVRSVNFELNDDIGVVMYPNPTRDRLFISISAGSEVSADEEPVIMILDDSGRLVRQQKSGLNILERMDIGELSPGLYIVKVIAGSEVFNNKLIKID